MISLQRTILTSHGRGIPMVFSPEERAPDAGTVGLGGRGDLN